MPLLPRKKASDQKPHVVSHGAERTPAHHDWLPVEAGLHKPITGLVGRLSGEGTLVTAIEYERTEGVVEIGMFLIAKSTDIPSTLDIVGAYAPKPYEGDGTPAVLSQESDAGRCPPPLTVVGA
jgi:hypothetical protein